MHLLLPLLIGLAFLKNKKWVILLSVLGPLVDADMCFGLHRQLFHNIFVTILIPLILFFIFKKNRIFLYALFFLVSHPLLDLESPGVPLFWPIYKNLFYVDAYAMAAGTKFSFFFDWGIISHTAVKFGVGGMAVAPTTTILAAIVLVAAIFKWKSIRDYLIPKIYRVTKNETFK